ncbi:MAG: hypothetical protein GWN71_40260, partial [Gammaproteobacteria bacterium]|nr:hypothetical protein [Gemmatimonadota bacterium]NIT87785.1 hypothetical protein [Gemmatimonadota bacterium]NIU79555.1 hypothetical protein [Gammaproteobacteria bacterium]NIX40050.1 hypothetical protein [Gemmatimonadota bacterium]
ITPAEERGARAAVLRLLLGVLLTTALASPLTGQDRLVRRFDSRNGLAAVTVFSLARDSTGFLWVGTVGGLYRFDGYEMRRWAPGRIAGRVVELVVEPDGRVLVLEEGEGLWTVEGRSAVPTPGPNDSSLSDAASLAADDQGALWILGEEGELWRRGPDDRWMACDRGAFGGEPPVAMTARPGGGVDVATAVGVWTVGAGLEPRRLASIRRVTAILSSRGGRRYLSTFLGEVYRLDPGEPPQRLFRVSGRGIDLVRRGDALWLSFARHLVRYEPGGTPEVLGPADGIEGGGPLLVDHEESLWLGTFTGLFQYPEPRTTLWGERHGLPSNHTRFLARTGDTMWVSTWQGLGRLTERGSGWRAGMEEAWQTRDVLTTDARGHLWSGSRRGLLEVGSGGPVLRDPRIRFLTATAPAGRDGLWLASGDDLFRVTTGSRAPAGAPTVRRVAGPHVPSDAWIRAVLEDAAGRLWIGYGNRICVAGVPEPGSGSGDLALGWRCWTVPEAGEVTDLVRVASGALWAASSHAGI